MRVCLCLEEGYVVSEVSCSYIHTYWHISLYNIFLEVISERQSHIHIYLNWVNMSAYPLNTLYLQVALSQQIIILLVTHTRYIWIGSLKENPTAVIGLYNARITEQQVICTVVYYNYLLSTIAIKIADIDVSYLKWFMWTRE